MRFYEVRARSVLNRVPAALADALPLDDQPLQGLQPCVRVLLRPPDPRYLGFDAGRDFEREIVVKVNAPEVLRASSPAPPWKREHVALGTNTDPTSGSRAATG